MAPLLLTLVLSQTPHLSYDRAVWCIGNSRVQCDEEKKECLEAPATVEGTEEELARTAYCVPHESGRRDQLIAEGYTFTKAIAEAPPGWYRDEQGRILQVNFDLHRRVYFGGAWAPQFQPKNGGATLGRGRTDFGIAIDISANRGRELHRIHLLEGSMELGPVLGVDAALIRYDWSALRNQPAFWISTFVGKPRRFDVDMNLSGWFEAARWELVQGQSFITIAAAAVTLDLWHAQDLESYVRIRLGPAAEFDRQTNAVAFKPFAAAEADFTLDRDGFHHLTASASAEKLFFEPALIGRHSNPSRLRFRAGYEVILLAINDYPLTFVLDGKATWRDDLIGVAPGWDFSGQAGLRFSFWAPARRGATPKS